MNNIVKISNKEGVKKIVMRPFAYTKCQIGQDWFRNDFEAVFIPSDCYPDYMQVEKYVQENIEGKELNIEQAARLLYNFLHNEYNPCQLIVYNHVKDCKTHFNVDITIE